MSGKAVSPTDVIAALEAARQSGPSALAFDADGTLWSGDVGEDTFLGACEGGLLREEARISLARVAGEYGISSEGTPSALAARLFDAYRAGTIDERLTCEIMTTCYAGYTEEELRTLANRIFAARGLRERTRAQLTPILAWARAAGVFVAVISASPRVIVREGLRVAGIDVDVDVVGAAVAATDPTSHSILPTMVEPVPYGPQKCVVGARILSGHDWLGSFGDNAFDVDMLRAARVSVAVCPKPALLARLPEVPNVLVLS
jgi:phosphoserine phosphatase